MTVILFDRNGKHVAAHDIDRKSPPSYALIWGDRVFIFSGRTYDMTGGYQYTEVDAVRFEK